MQETLAEMHACHTNGRAFHKIVAIDNPRVLRWMGLPPCTKRWHEVSVSLASQLLLCCG